MLATTREVTVASCSGCTVPTASVPEQCAKEGVDFQRFLLRLVEAEMLDRDQRATERRIKAARFTVVKTLETFDYLAIPSLNKKLMLELARCEWIGRKENVLCLGNSGTGKTHPGAGSGLGGRADCECVSRPRRRWCTN